LEGQSLNGFYQIFLQKKGCVIERICRGPLFVDYQEQPIQCMESIWLKCLVPRLCPKLNLLSKRQFPQDILLRLVEKTNQLYVVLALA
jgi:hypothetical protein